MSTEKKIDKAISKGFGKVKGRFLQKSRPDDVKPVRTSPLDVERKRADELELRAASSSAAIKSIESLIIQLAEKWKPEMSDLYAKVDEYRREHEGDPEILPVVLVDILIKSYEKEWKLRKLSEKWDFAMWAETERLLSDMHGHDTKETEQALNDYRNEVGSQREREVVEMDGFLDRLNNQSDLIERLEAENALLQQKQQISISTQAEEMMKKKEEHELVRTRMLVQEHDRQRAEIVELEKCHKEELQIAREEYDRSKLEAQDHFQNERLDLHNIYHQKYEQAVRDLGEKHTIDVEYHKSQNKLLAVQLGESRRSTQDKIEEAKAGFAEQEKRLKGEMDKKRADFNEHLAKVEQNNEAEKRELKRKLNLEISTLKFALDDLEESHTERVQQVEQRHLQGRKALEQSHMEAYEKQRRDHTLEITQLKERFEAREEELDVRFQKLQKEAKTETLHLRSKISRMEEEYRIERQQMITAHEREKDDLEAQMTEEVARVRSEHAKKKAQLEAVHAQSTSQLKNDVEAYSAALLARDDFTPMADNEIKSRFADLTEDVKTLGRLDWRADQKVWTAQVLKRLSSDNTSGKLFKRHILQEMIWIILHKHIFCSPFRPFGEEGQIMERKWNEAYGNDPKFENGCYTWPIPEMEGERWRYVNVKECRNALRQVVDSEWDPRAKLKMGFRSTLDEIRDEFISSVGDMVDLENSHIQAMEKIAKKAAIVWLDYGMQRCRIVMVFAISNLRPVQERIRQARVGSIELVAVPELRRYGNSKGLELHTEATVSGCSGEKVPVSMKH